MVNKLLSLLGVTLAITVFSLSFSQKQQIIDVDSLTGEYNNQDTIGTFNNQQFSTNEIAIQKLKNNVLGTNTGQKRIEVDLTTQRLYAFEGNEKIYEFLISSGKWGKTPTGTFTIWGKYRYTKMEGGKKELNTYYYLPNVPYVMFFENKSVPAYKGFGIHGTYWHSNFGHPMSHGCINMKTEEAGLLYNWAEPDLGENKSGRATEEKPGTQIIIYGVAPKS